MRLSMKRLRQDIGQGHFQTIYLLCGPEVFLKEKTVREICSQIVSPELREFNLDILYGDETDAATIVDRAASLPMMAQQRVVLVRNVDRLPIEERRKILEYSVSSEKRKLLEQLENKVAQKEKELQKQQREIDSARKKSARPATGPERRKLLGERDELLAEKQKVLEKLAFAFPHTCLLLLADAGDVVKLFYRGGQKKKTHGRRTSGLRAAPAGRTGSASVESGPGLKDNRASHEPWLNTFADRAVAEVVFRSLSEARVPEMIVQLARDRGKTIAPQAVQLLVQAIGSDLVALDNELNKLSIYIADRTEINSRDVEEVVGEMKVRSVWDLCDAVLSGDAAQSFSLLGRLFESGLAVPQLTGAMRWRFSRMVTGGGRGRANRGPKPLEECLEKAFGHLYEAEFSVNTGRRSGRMAMTLLIDQLCRLFVPAER